MQNTDFPVLCDKCLTSLRWAIKDGGTLGMHYCKHNQVLASVQASGGRFVQWWQQGPMSQQQAQELIDATTEVIAELSTQSNLKK